MQSSSVSNQTCMPVVVQQVANYCQLKNIPVVFSRNFPAGSCQDASEKRNPLSGETGIPLARELKSLVTRYSATNGVSGILALHCCGNETVNFKMVRNILRTKIGCKVTVEMLTPEELASIFDLEFGRVNPVLLDARSDGQVLQFFDNELMRQTDTMMTNAGDLTWGIEFIPQKMIAGVANHELHPFIKSVR